MMMKRLLTLFQYLLPQHLLSIFAGYIADSQQSWFKNFLIKSFIKKYPVNMQEALIEDPYAYRSFNLFFIRELKPSVRPITQLQNEIASPADGVIAQLGKINQYQLLQAKNMYFNLQTLLGHDNALAEQFDNGSFATFYLAPHNYHRVHMPIAGKLIKTIYVPGDLFSVNRMTSALIPNLYSRNERYICIFETTIGIVAVILVGAMIVGAIQTKWLMHPVRTKKIISETYTNDISFQKGDELGFFKLGSTVILLLPKNKIEWSPSLTSSSTIQMGRCIGNMI